MIAGRKRITSSKGNRWLSGITAAFGRRQQSRLTTAFLIVLVAWEYSHQSTSFTDSRIVFDIASRQLDPGGDNVTSVDTTIATERLQIQASESTSIPINRQPDTSIFIDTRTSQSTLFSRWKANIEANFRHEIEYTEKHGKGSKKNHTITRYETMLEGLEQVEDWGNDRSSWTSVSPDAFQNTVQQAHAEMAPLIENVHSDCILWIVPFKGRTGQRGVYKIKPKIQFQCDTRNVTRKMQENPCSDANLCLVQTDLRRWKYNATDIPYNRSLPNINYNEFAKQHNKSALLTVVDSTEYLHGNRIWACFLNKASFSILTQRPFFIWIGKMDDDTLHRRNTDVIKQNFGASCAPFGQDKNAVNYYKPIAFGALFHRQQLVRVETAFFLDADIYFNTEAEFSNVTKHHLEDYFDLSPQASLLGSQNPSGKDQNILINGGFLGLRRSEWVDNFSALWWFCRCGEKDQTALWLTLFAYWSSSSHASGNVKFLYPGAVFENYDYAWYAVMPHARLYLGGFQERLYASRELLVQGASNNGMMLSMHRPHQTLRFDGGNDFFQTPTNSSDLYTAPLELPNVLLLPIHSFQLRKDDESDTMDVYPPLVSKLKNDEGALLIHNKFPYNTCADQQCWPFRV